MKRDDDEDGDATTTPTDFDGDATKANVKRSSISDPETVEAIALWLERELLAKPPADARAFIAQRIEELRNGDWRLKSHRLRRAQPKPKASPSPRKRAAPAPTAPRRSPRPR